MPSSAAMGTRAQRRRAEDGDEVFLEEEGGEHDKEPRTEVHELVGDRRAASPGMAEMRAEAPADPAVSVSTLSIFSSMVAITSACASGDEKCGKRTSQEMSTATMSPA